LKPILTIHDLINQLYNTSKEDYNSIFENLQLNKKLFEEYESWSQKKYTRNCIYNDEQFELILLCWEKGQETSIHCHGGEECWLYLLEGEIEEVLYNKDENVTQKDIRKLQKLESSYINDSIGLHRLKNSFEGRTITLHLYAKPIKKCTFYDEKNSIFVSRHLKYDTIKEAVQFEANSF